MEACFREFDKDRDSKLNYDEFCLMMNTRGHSLELLLDHHATIGDRSPARNLSEESLKDDEEEEELAGEESSSDARSTITAETTVD